MRLRIADLLYRLWAWALDTFGCEYEAAHKSDGEIEEMRK